MPKRKANWWPPSILSDPDVLSVDDEGRFVLCKICHVHYAVHGGKKPKPVIMNSNFRTRAWDVHKGRTNSHRLQKQQERIEQGKAQVQHQATDPSGQQEEHTQSGQEQQKQVTPGQIPSHTQQNSLSIPALQTSTQTKMQAPLNQLQGQIKQAQTQHPLSHALQQPHNNPQDLQQRRQLQNQERYQKQLKEQEQCQQQQRDAKEIDVTGQVQIRSAAPDVAVKRSASVSSDLITATAMSDASKVHQDEKAYNCKRPATTMPMGGPLVQRRRVFRPGFSKQHSAESEPARGGAVAHYKKNNFYMAQGVARKTPPMEHAMAMEQQADSSARWRHMHDDVSRALNAAPRKRQKGSISYTSGDLRAAKTMAQTETGDLGGNNSERVAKKLRSLNAEYHASNMRHADAYNMRHSEVFDRSSAGYKEYWGTLRDVYKSSNTTSGEGSGPQIATSFRKAHHPRKLPIQVSSKETEADSTTPDDSGSSEDAFKPTVVIHDASLASAIERLTDATSSHIELLCRKETPDTKKTLVGLTSVMTNLRVQHGSAFERMIELQERQLKVMENILEIKLRKEAARNGSVISSGSSPEGGHGSNAPNQGAQYSLGTQSV